MVRLCFQPVIRGRHHLVLRYAVDDLHFSTTYWYDDVDFGSLEARYGTDFMRAVDFHLLAFEANKAASLAPTEIDVGPYADLVTDAFWELWSTLFHHVWGVWRFENDLPDYRLPRPRATAPAAPPPVEVGDGRSEAVDAVRRWQGQPRRHEAPRTRPGSSTTRSSTPTRPTAGVIRSTN